MLNRKHEGATTVNISDNVGLKLYTDDLRKSWDEDGAPLSYLSYRVIKKFNVEIYTKTKKQKKKVRNGYNEDGVGKGNVKDLLLIKDFLYSLTKELRDDECITVRGADERRFEIYKYFLGRDSRFDDIMYFNDSIIWLFNNSVKHSEYYSDLYDLIYEENQDLTDGEYNVIINRNPKEEKKRDKEWEELMWVR